ncbi:serine hydrolase [Listeria ivanovii]|uniref:Putative some similarities to probable beta-lactamase n=2 Tax=Listeria ivanovii TaxID=1638 RepID=G2Z9E9_LISIP|nr:serine hydrolase [Listeria ivanovii]AHI54746.1 beta-lactamase [Listeria ivanovii WSLC3009]AIS64213.1 beta-lactamase [Listeria ivanovii subsp. ivanovii]MBC1760624.1 serine hydrolase [Listeria ivanovii]MCJ1718590.1 class A beta-lactamase-related serine hydrolase [Listeria ivanovii]MCJ1723724.1 class A beta-lactamase-related serine hydrolase [Listeria ivanovii]
MNTYMEINKTYEMIDSKALYISDEKQTLFAENENQLYTAASVIKLPIYLYFFEKISNGELNLQTEIQLSPDRVVAGAGIIQILPQKRTWRLEELLHLMIAISDNTATNQLIELASLQNLQAWLGKKGWEKSARIERKMMDFKAAGENKITAKLAVTIFQEIMELTKKYPNLTETIRRPFLNQQHRSNLTGTLEEAGIAGLQMLNKTGELKDIQHDVAIFEYQGEIRFVAALTNNTGLEANSTAWMQTVGKQVFAQINQK